MEQRSLQSFQNDLAAGLLIALKSVYYRLCLLYTSFDHSNDPVQSFLLIRTLADELYLVAAFDEIGRAHV